MTRFIPKEVSWLSFNQRVLQEAANPDVPLLERIRFLGIYSNNLDEFFRVRVATLKRLEQVKHKTRDLVWIDASEVLEQVRQIVYKQRVEYEKLFHQLLEELASNHIYLVNETQLNPVQKEFVQEYFNAEVRPRLMPIMLGQVNKFPLLRDDNIYLAVVLDLAKKDKTEYALIRIPTDLCPRFIKLPSSSDEHYIIYLDDVIRFGLSKIFSIFKLKGLEAFTIKITKDAELDIDDDLTESFVSKVARSIERRKKGSPVRFLYDSNLPADFLEYLKLKLKLKDTDTLIPGGRYHNTKDFMQFPKIPEPHLKYPEHEEIPYPPFDRSRGILRAVRKKDHLLHFPYQSFGYFIDLLREASIDPKVKEIKITLYRLAKNSSVVYALRNALKNGKEVTAVVELQARFDEEANIYYAQQLKEAGARVIYGVLDLKVHAKICLITRREKKQNKLYAVFSTGNFNEETAGVFSDMMFLTSNQELTYEASRIFDFFERNYDIPQFQHLIVAPFNYRQKIKEFILKEIENHKKKLPAFIHLKLNNLVDEEIILLLERAVKEGVEVILNVRGMFGMNTSELLNRDNFQAFGIVDRFLEHARMMIFGNGGEPLYFLSSADLMTRNLDRRVEVTWPVFDPDIQEQIRKVFDIQLKDNTKARILDPDLSNKIRTHHQKPVRSQVMIYEYYQALYKKLLAEEIT